jgi:hypothetical protein
MGPFIMHTFKRLGIKRIRNCNPSDWEHHRMLALALFCLTTNGKLSEFHSPQRLVTHFSANYKDSFANFPKILIQLFKKYDTLEVTTHPGLCDCKGSYLQRKSEYEFLRNNMPLLQKKQLKNIELISYSEL